MQPPDFPLLVVGQIAIAFAETATGIILTPSGDRLCDGGLCFHVFDSLPAAENSAATFILDHPTAECWFYNHSGKAFRRITNTLDEAINA